MGALIGAASGEQACTAHMSSLRGEKQAVFAPMRLGKYWEALWRSACLRCMQCQVKAKLQQRI